jgi:hypothetical protein
MKEIPDRPPMSDPTQRDMETGADMVTMPTDDPEVLRELDTGVRFLGAGHRCPRWTEATRADHDEAIRALEAAVHAPQVVLDAEAIDDARAKIAKHRAVLQGGPLVFVATHPDHPVPFDDDAAVWAARVHDQLGKAVAAIVATGRELLAAKAELKHGDWGRLFRDHPLHVVNPLRFSDTTARRFMKIAKNPVLANPAHGPLLPPSYRTLYELTKMSPDSLEQALADGLIDAELDRGQAEWLVREAATERGELRAAWAGRAALNRRAVAGTDQDCEETAAVAARRRRESRPGAIRPTPRQSWRRPASGTSAKPELQHGQHAISSSVSRNTSKGCCRFSIEPLAWGAGSTLTREGPSPPWRTASCGHSSE